MKDEGANFNKRSTYRLFHWKSCFHAQNSLMDLLFLDEGVGLFISR